jgi:hypothetical protein
MERLKFRLGWALAGALGIVLVLTVARATVAGPLDPPGPVGSTMRTLGDLVPAWDQTLTSSGGCTSQRFTCVLGGAAALDSETGLVWEKAPSGTPVTWAQAISGCQSVVVGTRLGWRLPSSEELRSLADGATLNLPVGHPFVGIPASSPADLYWSSTTQVDDATRAEAVSFFVAAGTAEPIKTGSFLRWCVRGGKGIDGQ